MATKTGELRAALEAARAASLAVHAAAGLAAPCSRQAVRLLRAAEGLVRSAVAVLSVLPPPQPAPAAAPVAGVVAAPLRRRRPRGKRKEKAAKMEVDTVDLHTGLAATCAGEDEVKGALGCADGNGAVAIRAREELKMYTRHVALGGRLSLGEEVRVKKLLEVVPSFGRTAGSEVGLLGKPAMGGGSLATVPVEPCSAFADEARQLHS